MGCMQSNDEVIIGKMGMNAVGANLNQVDNDVLDMALAGNNPNSLLKSKVSLTFSASKLPNLDEGSKSDPFLVCYQLNPRTNSKQMLGMTEVVSDNLSPAWIKSIDVDYMFEE